MKKTSIFFYTILFLGFTFICWPTTEAQQGHKEKPKINQHFKVIPNIPPNSLEDEIKKLNDQGFSITKDNIYILEDKFTLMVSDDDIPEDDDENEDGN